MFEIRSNPQLDKNSFTFSKNSKYPYFTRTVFNNGILGYVDYLDEEHLVKGNALAVGMMGMHFFYMNHDFYAGQFTKSAFPLFEGFNESVALWFISWFNKSSGKYLDLLVRDFENAFNNTELIVPYRNGKVAVDYIESRIRELEESRIRELEAYLIAAGFEDCTLTDAERAVLKGRHPHFMEIPIGDLFLIKKGTRLTKANMHPGRIRFIGATADNNGITNLISNSLHTHPANTITVTYNGSVGEAFYQTEQFWASDDVNVLYPKDTIDENLALYFLAPIRKKGAGYAYTFKWTKEKMAQDSIWVPFKNVDGQVVCDYQYMDTYINAIKKQYIAALKQEINREHEAYEKAISIKAPKIVVLPEYRKGCVPLYTLRAACGYFEGGELPEAEGWVDASGNGFIPDPKRHFAVHAKGNSMLPKIQDGNICVFEWYHAGSRNNEIVLTECSERDNDYGGMYTIKKYHSNKVDTNEGWQHTKIELIPLNEDYETIDLNSETEYRTVGLLKCVL